MSNTSPHIHSTKRYTPHNKVRTADKKQHNFKPTARFVLCRTLSYSVVFSRMRDAAAADDANNYYYDNYDDTLRCINRIAARLCSQLRLLPRFHCARLKLR